PAQPGARAGGARLLRGHRARALARAHSRRLRPLGTGVMADDNGKAARALLAAESVGVLSTLSVHRAGYPYGSVTPYALSAAGAPRLLRSGLPAHTKNLPADPRACLFVGDRTAAADPQAGARVSLLGRAAPVTPHGQPAAPARSPRGCA